jgi:hypothetical protein
VSAPPGNRALVVGELRGYRQFDLADGALLPMVHRELGPWAGRLERAQCALHADHEPPDPTCTCGLYALFRPGSATVSLGAANAVVAARGRCVLGDRGFRAAAARIEAVALPATVRWSPRAARRARRRLTERYPGTVVYGSTRRMLRDHPAADVRPLGIDPPPDRSRGYRAVAVGIWGLLVVVGYGLALLPQDAVRASAASWWPVLLLLVVAWQVAFAWLLTRLMALQTPEAHDR